MKNIAVTFILMLLVSGCFSGSRPSHFYQLQAVDGTVDVLSKRRLSVGVEEVLLPKYLDRPQIVTMEADSAELTISEFNRWAEPLSGAFARVLADDISAYLPNSVVKFKIPGAESFTYAVTVEVNKLDAVLGKKLEMDVWWTIYKDERTIARQRSRLERTLGNSYENLVEQQSSVIGELAREIALRLAKLQ